jgi:hypothetical protein
VKRKSGSKIARTQRDKGFVLKAQTSNLCPSKPQYRGLIRAQISSSCTCVNFWQLRRNKPNPSLLLPVRQKRRSKRSLHLHFSFFAPPKKLVPPPSPVASTLSTTTPRTVRGKGCLILAEMWQPPAACISVGVELTDAQKLYRWTDHLLFCCVFCSFFINALPFYNFCFALNGLAFLNRTDIF